MESTTRSQQRPLYRTKTVPAALGQQHGSLRDRLVQEFAATLDAWTGTVADLERSGHGKLRVEIELRGNVIQIVYLEPSIRRRLVECAAAGKE